MTSASVEAITFTSNKISLSGLTATQVINYNGIDYTVTAVDATTGAVTMTGFYPTTQSPAGAFITMDLNKTAITNLGTGSADLVYIHSNGGHEWGVSINSGNIKGIWHQSGQTRNSNWGSKIAVRSVDQIPDEPSLVTTLINSDGTFMYKGATTANDNNTLFKNDGLKASSQVIQSVSFNKNYIDYVYLNDAVNATASNGASAGVEKYWVTNAAADGSYTWSKLYSTWVKPAAGDLTAPATDETAVQGTLISEASVNITVANAAGITARSGDLVVGGAGQLVFKGEAGNTLTVGNAIVLGTSTNANKDSQGAIYFDNANGAITLNGAVNLVEDSTIGSSSTADSPAAVRINGTLSGTDRTLIVTKGRGIEFHGGLTLGTLNLKGQSHVTIADNAATIGTLDSTLGSGESHLTVNGTTLDVTGSAWHVSVLHTDATGVINIAGNYVNQKSGVGVAMTGAGHVNITGNFTNSENNYTVNVGSTVGVGGNFTTNRGVNVTGHLTVDGALSIGAKVTVADGASLTLNGSVVAPTDANIANFGTALATGVIDTTGTAATSGFTYNDYHVVESTGTGTLTVADGIVAPGTRFTKNGNNLDYRWVGNVYNVNEDMDYATGDVYNVTSGTVNVTDGNTLALNTAVKNGVTLTTAGTGVVSLSGTISSIGGANNASQTLNLKVANNATATLSYALHASPAYTIMADGNLTFKLNGTYSRLSLQGSGNVTLNLGGNVTWDPVVNADSKFSGTLTVNQANHLFFGKNSTTEHPQPFTTTTNLVLTGGNADKGIVLNKQFAVAADSRDYSNALVLGSLSSESDQTVIRGDVSVDNSRRYIMLHQSGETTYAGRFIHSQNNNRVWGDPGLVMNGTGNIVLTNSGNNSYAKLVVKQGTVTLKDDGTWYNENAAATGIEVWNGGTLAYEVSDPTSTKTMTEKISFAEGSTLKVVSGTLAISDARSISNAVLEDGATLKVGEGGSLTLGGEMTMGNGSILWLSGTGTELTNNGSIDFTSGGKVYFGTGVFEDADAVYTLGGILTNFSLATNIGGLGGRQEAHWVDQSAGTFNVSGAIGTLTWTGDSGAWNKSVDTWTEANNHEARFFDEDNVIFDGGGNAITITQAAGESYRVSDMTVTGGAEVVVNGSLTGVGNTVTVSCNGTLTVNGTMESGALNLTGTADHTASINVEADATASFSDGISIGGDVALSVADGGTLNGAITVGDTALTKLSLDGMDMTISEAGKLGTGDSTFTKSGSGTLTLDSVAQMKVGGTVIVEGGKLVVDKESGEALLKQTVVQVGAGATFETAAHDALGFTGNQTAKITLQGTAGDGNTATFHNSFATTSTL